MTLERMERYAAGVVALALVSCSSTPSGGDTVRAGPRGASGSPATALATPSNAAANGGSGTGSGLTASDNPNAGAVVTAMTQGSAGSGLKEGQCARQDISTTRVVPTIWLLLDGSGSMVEILGDNTSRFDALKAALMDPMTGVVKTLEHDVQWGYVMYDGPLPEGVPAELLPDGAVAMFSSPPATTCPRIVSVEPKKDNYDDIAAMYPPDPLGGSTPTDKALEAVIAHLPNGASPMLDAKVNPTIVVLATDGAPNDFCSDAFPPRDVRPSVIADVKTLLAANIKTYVISLAGDDQMLTQHLTDVAAAGGTGKPPFIPTNKDQLVQIFKDIIGPGAACDVVLSGKVKMGSECKGMLQINGSPLACDDDNGWRLKDESTITITGTACTSYKMDATAVLHADFPCDVFMLN